MNLLQLLQWLYQAALLAGFRGVRQHQLTGFGGLAASFGELAATATETFAQKERIEATCEAENQSGQRAFESVAMSQGFSSQNFDRSGQTI